MKPVLKSRLSSKSQITIPEEVRTSLGLCPGAQFEVIGEQDRIILKLIAETPLEKFDCLVNKTRVLFCDRVKYKKVVILYN